MRTYFKEFIATILAPFSGLRPPPKSSKAFDAQVSSAAELALDATLPPGSFCMPSERFEPLLRDAAIEILHTVKCASGVTGAQLFYLRLPTEALVFKAKWKAAKTGGTGLNNEPRKEVATYLVQKWFLSPDEYVVPPTVCRAIPLVQHMSGTDEEATFDDTECVLGCLSFWVDNMKEMQPFDEPRFESDARYRDAMANLNLLTHLVDHRDPRAANFLFSKDPDRTRALSIDNSLAFSGLINPRVLFLHEWRQLIVPKLPRAKIDFLRAVSRAELLRLRVVAQFVRRDGQLTSVDPEAPLPGDDEEAVVWAGDVLQLGLKVSEIDGIEERITKLLSDVDAGKIELY
jgi:hypothetical protein